MVSAQVGTALRLTPSAATGSSALIGATAGSGLRAGNRPSHGVLRAIADLARLGAFPAFAGPRPTRVAVASANGGLWSNPLVIALLLAIVIGLAGLATTRVGKH